VSLAFANNCSNGIEPDCDEAYRRSIRIGDDAPQAFRVGNHAHSLFQSLNGNGAVLPDYFARAAETAPADHIATLAALQPCVDAAISKTVILSSDSTNEQVYALFFEEWRAGVKGITIFRHLRPNPMLDGLPRRALDTRERAPCFD
jgi:ribonucleoside-diphosphate reductase alpha chain